MPKAVSKKRWQQKRPDPVRNSRVGGQEEVRGEVNLPLFGFEGKKRK
jgi:hypothetical protein